MAESATATTKKRIAFDFSEAALEEFDALKDAVGETTRAGLLRRAIELFDYLHEARRKGADILIREQDGTTERLARL